MNDLTELNEFARVFADKLFDRYPAWREFAEAYSPGDAGPAACLVVKVPVPEDAHVDRPLMIYADDEVTVDFDCFHCHYDWPPSSSESDNSSNALEFIEAILTEKVGIISWWRGDKLAVSTTFDPELPDPLQPPPDSSRLRRRSWQGTFNAEIAL